MSAFVGNSTGTNANLVVDGLDVQSGYLRLRALFWIAFAGVALLGVWFFVNVPSSVPNSSVQSSVNAANLLRVDADQAALLLPLFNESSQENISVSDIAATFAVISQQVSANEHILFRDRALAEAVSNDIHTSITADYRLLNLAIAYAQTQYRAGGILDVGAYVERMTRCWQASEDSAFVSTTSIGVPICGS